MAEVKKTIHLELITPSEIAIHRDVYSIIAPGIDGYLGILPGHTNLITSLKPGKLILKFGEEEKVLRIGSGYLEVTPAQVILLTEFVKVSEEEREEMEKWAIEYEPHE
ncbi:MAG TPA: ATP synthase F1 subunit epsilon [Firmicutes bacterium]|nr:MAG: ATP synthase F1 subunit epsilon [Candidatus Coatesbacteria bacterium]HEC80409.1 ATP synthase F1 subunit epsilon [Bacillota bacterium]